MLPELHLYCGFTNIHQLWYILVNFVFHFLWLIYVQAVEMKLKSMNRREMTQQLWGVKALPRPD